VEQPVQSEDGDVLGSWFCYWDAEVHRIEPFARLYLLEADLRSVRYALLDFNEAQRSSLASIRSLAVDAPATDEATDSAQRSGERTFHYATTFVVAVRRFARLLEAAKGAAREYPAPIAEAIATAWRSAKPFLEQYRIARDAIEHIDGEITGSNKRFMNLWHGELEVVTGTQVAISAVALDVIERAWRRIADAVTAPARAEALGPVREALMAALRDRVVKLDAAERPHQGHRST
jgi:hypothetical protein